MSLTGIITMDGIAPMSKWKVINRFRDDGSRHMGFLQHDGENRIKIHYIRTNLFEIWITCKDETKENAEYAYRMWNFLQKNMLSVFKGNFTVMHPKQKRKIAKEVILECFKTKHGIWWDFDYLREDKAKDLEYAMEDMFGDEIQPIVFCKNCSHEIICINGVLSHRHEREVGRCSVRKDYEHCGCFKPERE